MNLDLEKLRTLIDLLVERDIAEFEHEDEQGSVRIVRRAEVTHVSGSHAAAFGHGGPAHAHAVAHTQAAAPAVDDTLAITSPFVGTFYSSPSPDAPAFVSVGSTIRAGQTLCIIEAMKLMNEIEAETAGIVVEIVAQNGKPVEFGQILYRIKKP